MKFQINKNQIHNFWIYQFVGWGLIFSVNIIQILTSRIIVPRRITVEFMECFIGFFLTSLLRYYYRKINFLTNSILSGILRIGFISILISFIWYLLFFFLKKLFFPNLPYHQIFDISIFVGWTLSLTPIIFSWSALYFGLKTWFEWNLQKSKTEQANNIANEACLQMLRYQINPHFLFNALNSVRALIGENDTNAKIMITELSDFLRYPLTNKTSKEVPLKVEIAAIKTYLSIERKRYEDKLYTEINIDPKVEEYPILSYLLHPLVENALKYGMKTSEMPLKIYIRGEKTESGIKLSIINSGKWIPPEENLDNGDGTGTGLENVKQRLKHTFHDNFRFEHLERDGKVFIIINYSKN